ncbi:MAG: hypothetical protein J5I98_15285 [Phaeodactylibacter sp.]|nr:hypothetical protein [Phaeodactylibacter sp.]
MDKNKINLEDFPLYPLYQKMVAYDRSRALGHEALDVETFFVLHQAFAELVDAALRKKAKGRAREWKNARGALLVFYALQQGRQLISKEELYHVCRLVLLKPHHSEEKFRMLFEEYLRGLSEQQAKAQEKEKENKQGDSEKTGDGKSDAQKDAAGEKAGETGDGTGGQTGEGEMDGQEQYEEQYETVAIKFEKLEGEGDAFLLPSQEQHREPTGGPQQFVWDSPHRTVDIRTVQQAFRSQREEQQRARRWQVDVEETIREVCQTGVWHGIRFRPEVSYQTSVALLVDSGKSMVAFQAFADDLINIVSASPVEEQAQPHACFFHNCPSRFVFRDRALTEAVSLAQFIAKMGKPLILFSDAGAARNGYSRQRVEQTRAFLRQLGDKHVAWVNPVPRFRWYGTSAYEISKMVNMVDATQEEFVNIVDILKGRIRPKYFE